MGGQFVSLGLGGSHMAGGFPSRIVHPSSPQQDTSHSLTPPPLFPKSLGFPNL